MRHELKVCISKETPQDGIVSCRHISIRQRLLNFILGKPLRFTLLVPGDNVDSISIIKLPDRTFARQGKESLA